MLQALAVVLSVFMAWVMGVILLPALAARV
jgi:hypothetical protein